MHAFDRRGQTDKQTDRQTMQRGKNAFCLNMRYVHGDSSLAADHLVWALDRSYLCSYIRIRVGWFFTLGSESETRFKGRDKSYSSRDVWDETLSNLRALAGFSRDLETAFPRR